MATVKCRLCKGPCRREDLTERGYCRELHLSFDELPSGLSFAAFRDAGSPTRPRIRPSKIPAALLDVLHPYLEAARFDFVKDVWAQEFARQDGVLLAQ